MIITTGLYRNSPTALYIFERYLNFIHVQHSLYQRIISVQLQKLLQGLMIAFFLSLEVLIAQPIRFEHISTEQGLPSNEIICMIKDRHGFMWLGTTGGLIRYDGYSFRQFTQGPGNNKALSVRIIYALLEDKSGMIWIGSNGGGLNKFDPLSEKITSYRHDPKNPKSLSHDEVFALYEDLSGKLWIGTTGGLDYFDREKQIFEHFDPDNAFDPITNKTIVIYERPSEPGILLLGTFGGLKRFESNKKIFTRFSN